ncbi:unnamed protein product [Symbiodinium sp. CCMP2592]|nr:unnamed protein product [Symbiodinium sp. CCMP2592]
MEVTEVFNAITRESYDHFDDQSQAHCQQSFALRIANRILHWEAFVTGSAEPFDSVGDQQVAECFQQNGVHVSTPFDQLGSLTAVDVSMQLRGKDKDLEFQLGPSYKTVFTLVCAAMPCKAAQEAGCQQGSPAHTKEASDQGAFLASGSEPAVNEFANHPRAPCECTEKGGLTAVAAEYTAPGSMSALTTDSLRTDSAAANPGAKPGCHTEQSKRAREICNEVDRLLRQIIPGRTLAPGVEGKLIGLMEQLESIAQEDSPLWNLGMAIGEAISAVT